MLQIQQMRFLASRAVICQNKFLSRTTAIVAIGPRQIGKPNLTWNTQSLPFSYFSCG